MPALFVSGAIDGGRSGIFSEENRFVAVFASR